MMALHKRRCDALRPVEMNRFLCLTKTACIGMVHGYRQDKLQIQTTMKIIFATIMGLIMLTQVSAQSPVAIPTKPEVVFVNGVLKQWSLLIVKYKKVKMPSFSISKYEITVEQYRAFCDYNSRPMPESPEWGWLQNHPIVNVSFEDAVAYCEWLSQKFGGKWRLPTVEEWEYAARGGNKSKGYYFAGSNKPELVGWFTENANAQTNAVGQKRPNELSIYDMSGNVWEWCATNNKDLATTYNDTYAAILCEICGGSWMNFMQDCELSFECRTTETTQGDEYLGFRVVLVE